MKKIQTKTHKVPATTNEAVVLSADAQTMRDFKTSLFIVSVVINVLLLIFWITYEVTRAQL